MVIMHTVIVMSATAVAAGQSYGGVQSRAFIFFLCETHSGCVYGTPTFHKVQLGKWVGFTLNWNRNGAHIP